MRKLKNENLKLVLLPPKEKKEVTKEDIKNFYVKLIILLSDYE